MQNWTRLGHRHRFCWLFYILLAGLFISAVLGLAAYRPPPSETSITLEVREVYIIESIDENDTHFFIIARLEGENDRGQIVLAKDGVIIHPGELDRLEVTLFEFYTESGQTGRVVYYDLYLTRV